MIVRFTNYGKGNAKSCLDYLLKKDGEPRENARLLRGDPDAQVLLCNSLSFKNKYTSGWLVFDKGDHLTEEQKIDLMDDFEKTIRVGLDEDRISVTWVEHTDKDQLELNFVFANVDLKHGRFFQPYYHAQDLRRVNAWKDIQNIKHGFKDPSDPANRRLLAQRSNLPRPVKQAREEITNGLIAMASNGDITSRQDVLEALKNGGFEVTRETKTSISIKNPDPDAKRPIRLTGALYERDFRFSDELQQSIARQSEEYRANAGARLAEAQTLYASEMERKRSYHQQRHGKARKSHIEHAQLERVSRTTGAGHAKQAQKIASQYRQHDNRTSTNHRGQTATTQAGNRPSVRRTTPAGSESLNGSLVANRIYDISEPKTIAVPYTARHATDSNNNRKTHGFSENGHRASNVGQSTSYRGSENRVKEAVSDRRGHDSTGGTGIDTPDFRDTHRNFRKVVNRAENSARHHKTSGSESRPTVQTPTSPPKSEISNGRTANTTNQRSHASSARHDRTAKSNVGSARTVYIRLASYIDQIVNVRNRANSIITKINSTISRHITTTSDGTKVITERTQFTRQAINQFDDAERDIDDRIGKASRQSDRIKSLANDVKELLRPQQQRRQHSQDTSEIRKIDAITDTNRAIATSNKQLTQQVEYLMTRSPKPQPPQSKPKSNNDDFDFSM